MLDLDHLSKQTGGDSALQRELLAIFRHRSVEIIEKMHALACLSPRHGVGLRDLAHQLRGSALALGAFTVAREAATIEQIFAPDPRIADGIATQSAAATLTEAAPASLIRLSTALTETLAAIDAIQTQL